MDTHLTCDIMYLLFRPPTPKQIQFKYKIHMTHNISMHIKRWNTHNTNNFRFIEIAINKIHGKLIAISKFTFIFHNYKHLNTEINRDCYS